jgi:hypothetical protein
MNSINKIVYIKDSSKTNLEMNKNITRYNIIAPHKCGSSILKQVLRRIFERKGYACTVKRGYAWTVNSINSAGEHESVEYRFSRRIPEDLHGQSKCIFIPRNPLAISISMFYSFAYTHLKPEEMTEKRWQNFQAKQQKMGCEKFVEKCISTNCKKIKGIFNSDRDKTIIPYELMVVNFELFLQKFLDSLNLSDFYGETFNVFKERFQPIEDKSDDIVLGNYKGHRRTTDINEWQSKFNETTLSRYMDKYPMIKEYHDYIQSFNLKELK